MRLGLDYDERLDLVVDVPRLGRVEQDGDHLPWAFKPMNFDLAAQVARVNRKANFPFRVFYSQNVTFSDLMEAQPGRVFSLPIHEDPRGTWDQTIYEHLLDEDVGLLLEANVIADGPGA